MVIGPSGVGKSISLRRYQQELDEARYQIIEFTYLPSTVNGFLRSLCRSLSLPMRLHSTDLFDAAQRHLSCYEKDLGKHPILLIDDAEGLCPEVLDTIRRLTCFDLDSDDRFSVLLSGTDALIPLLADATLTSLRSRFAFTCSLRPFGLEDTINYVRFHLQRSEFDPKLFTEPAIKKLFQASQGRPRKINQLASRSRSLRCRSQTASTTCSAPCASTTQACATTFAPGGSMTCLSDQGTPAGIYAIVIVDDHTRLILGVRIVDAEDPQAGLPTPQDADDFDLSDPAMRS